MPTEETPGIEVKGTNLASPQSFAGTNAAGEFSVDVAPADASEVMPQFQGKVFRIMDGQVFVVDPGSPPQLPTR
jgi:hypothetical protein